jgi:hypothetical protein
MNQAAVNVGRIVSAVHPAIGPHAISTADQNVDSPMVTVLASVRVNRKANKNSFQEKIRQKTAVIAAPGLINGNIIFRRIANRP